MNAPRAKTRARRPELESPPKSVSLTLEAPHSVTFVPWLLCAILLLFNFRVETRSVGAVSTPSPPMPRLRFSPLDIAAIRSISPLGNLNPRGGHVFPTDHIYLDYGRQPGLIRISVGGTLAPAGLYQPDEGSPDPAQVSPASGRINYRVRFYSDGRTNTASILVQMLANDRIKVEYFPDATE